MKDEGDNDRGTAFKVLKDFIKKTKMERVEYANGLLRD